MNSYVAFLRGINVGGKNKVSMPELAAAFADGGYEDVRTHGQSGNVLFTTAKAGGPPLETAVEKMLAARFGVPILVIVRSKAELAATVKAAPADHGSAKLRSEVIFLKHPLTATQAMAEVPELREGVDAIAAGPGALYFSRVAAKATTTRIQQFMAKPVFQRMTMRTWATVEKLLGMLD